VFCGACWLGSEGVEEIGKMRINKTTIAAIISIAIVKLQTIVTIASQFVLCFRFCIGSPFGSVIC